MTPQRQLEDKFYNEELFNNYHTNYKLLARANL